MKIIEKLNAKKNDLKGAPPVTIAFLGDSVTHGCFDMQFVTATGIDAVFDAENAYHTKLRKIFNMLYPSAVLNIINAGISGNIAAEGLARIERDVLKFSPDLCVVCFGLNDSIRSTVEEHTASISTILDTLKAKGIEAILMTPNMMAPFNKFPQDHHLHNITEKAVTVQCDGTLDTFIAAAKKVAKEKGVPVCDCYAKWQRLYDGGVNITELLSNKINHPTPDMNWLFAYSLVETMFLN